MKFKFTLSAILFASLLFKNGRNGVFAQSPSWLWAKSGSGGWYDYARDITTDTTGNSYITGYFHSSPFVFGTDTLNNKGSADIYITKYDSEGNDNWTKSAGGSTDDVGNKIAVDGTGNVFVTGYTQSSYCVFDADTLFNTGGRRVFVVKYDSVGNVKWAKIAIGISEGKSITTDSIGNIYITGSFQTSYVVFGSDTLYNSDLNGGFTDAFIVKYDSSGNVQWVKSIGGTGSEVANDVSTDADLNIYLVGLFYDSSLVAGNDTITNAGLTDIFISKFDSTGNPLWAKGIGSTNNEAGNSIFSDNKGSIYISGSFMSSSITFGSNSLYNIGVNDVFIAKYSTEGDCQWAKSGNGSKNEEGFGVSADSVGNVYITGLFESQTISFGNLVLTNAYGNSRDIFIVKYDSMGNVLWAKSAGGTGTDVSVGISTDPIGNVYISGYFGAAPLAFGNTTLITKGTYDIFIAKLSAMASTEITTDAIKSEITIFPNPSNGKFSIQMQKIQNAQINIYNMLGELIYSSVISSPLSEFDLGKHGTGIFYYHVILEQSTIKTGKLLVIR